MIGISGYKFRVVRVGKYTIRLVKRDFVDRLSEHKKLMLNLPIEDDYFECSDGTYCVAIDHLKHVIEDTRLAEILLQCQNYRGFYERYAHPTDETMLILDFI